MCGYCGRRCVPVGGCYECPRCAPILRTLGRGLPWAEIVDAYAQFQRDAARDRVPIGLTLFDPP